MEYALPLACRIILQVCAIGFWHKLLDLLLEVLVVTQVEAPWKVESDPLASVVASESWLSLE